MNRLAKIMDENQPPEQAGFRANYSTIDHIHTINQVIEKTHEFNQRLYVAFIDYKKAFDSIEHNFMLKALENIGINPKYIRILYEIYRNSKAIVKTEIEGETFRVKRGVKQGDPISPKLFTCTLEAIFRGLSWSKKRKGININGRLLSNLRFADDIVLFAKSATELQEMLAELNTKSAIAGLQMNPTKTKAMTNHIETPIIIDDTPIHYCSEYIYLGQAVSLTENGDNEIQRRIRQAWGKFWGLKFLLLDKDINRELRLEALQTCIIPTLTYGSQTWTLTKEQELKIQRCQRRMERKILDIKLVDKVRNEELRLRSGIEEAHKQARELKWRWGGHVARLPADRWAYATTIWDPRRGKRGRGRPRRRWAQDFIEVIGPQWSRLARDRREWRITILDLE